MTSRARDMPENPVHHDAHQGPGPFPMTRDKCFLCLDLTHLRAHSSTPFGKQFAAPAPGWLRARGRAASTWRRAHPATRSRHPRGDECDVEPFQVASLRADDAW